MLAYFDTNPGWGELVKRTLKETQADNGLGLAAQLAYYFFLALFPALLFLIALAGLFASQGLITRVVGMLSDAAWRSASSTRRRCARCRLNSGMRDATRIG